MNLQDKICVVTGAAQGIGLAITKMLIGEGATVVMLDANPDALNSCDIDSPKIQCDVSDVNDVTKTFSSILEKHGAVDVLVNNAGITRDAVTIKKDKETGVVKPNLSVENFDLVLAVNLRGSFLCAQAAAVQMANAGKSGVIINMSSVNAAGMFSQANYSASKAGASAMTVVHAQEFARFGIRVGAVAPGYTGTEMVLGMPDKAKEAALSRVPSKRFGDVTEIAGAVKFIIENDYFTGRVLEVDGGLRC